MRERTLRNLLLITCLATTAAAMPAIVNSQIVIGSSDLITLEADGYSSTVWAVDTPGFPSLQAIFDQVGPNQVFDFSSVSVLPPSTSTSTVFPSAAGTPGQDEPALGAANHVLFRADADAESWSYRTLSGSALVEHGTIVLHDLNSDGTTDTTIIRNQPSDTSAVFPLEYGRTWNETFVRTSSIGGMMNESLQEHEAAADAWGQLVTPVGTAPVLRLRETRVTTVDVGGTNVQSIMTLVAYYSTTGLSATIIANEAGEVVAGAYAINASGGTLRETAAASSFRVGAAYPNPFSESATIPIDIVQPTLVSVRIFDLLGRHVETPFERVLTGGKHHIRWTPTGAAGGVYVVQLHIGTGHSTQSVVHRPR